jgi:hypothetical protein
VVIQAIEGNALSELKQLIIFRRKSTKGKSIKARIASNTPSTTLSKLSICGHCHVLASAGSHIFDDAPEASNDSIAMSN